MVIKIGILLACCFYITNNTLRGSTAWYASMLLILNVMRILSAIKQSELFQQESVYKNRLRFRKLTYILKISICYMRKMSKVY